MSKHTTLKLQLTTGKIVDLITTWDEEEQVYRITCREIPHLLARTPTLADAKTHVLRAIWSGGGRC